MNALSKKLFNIRELKYLGLLFLIFYLIFIIAFFRNNLLNTLRVVFSIFWILIIPGYFITFYWKGKIGFLERVIIGTAMAGIVLGVVSYYFGLFGLNIKYHLFLIPTLLIVSGIFLSLLKK